MSMKTSTDTIRDRNRDLPACSTVSQPTASPRTPSCGVGGEIAPTAAYQSSVVPSKRIVSNQNSRFLTSVHQVPLHGVKPVVWGSHDYSFSETINSHRYRICQVFEKDFSKTSPNPPPLFCRKIVQQLTTLRILCPFQRIYHLLYVQLLIQYTYHTIAGHHI